MKTNKSELLEMLYQLAEQIIKFENDGVEINSITMASDLGIAIDPSLNHNELNVIFNEKERILVKKMN